MSFYGPWTGDYLTDLGRKVADRLADRSPALPGPRPGRFEPIGRGVLAALLGVWLIQEGGSVRSRWRSLDLGSRLVHGFGLAVALAWCVAPESVEWSSVGLPGWSRWLGLPVALVAVAGARTGETWRSRRSLAFGASAFLLSACWSPAEPAPKALGVGEAAGTWGVGVDHPGGVVRKSGSP